MFTSNKKNKELGFTLIEIMVAVSIFALVMVVAVGAVLSIVSANKKAQALNAVITNLNFALEGMMRDLRTGYEYSCNAVGGIADCPNDPGGGTSVSFISSQSGGQRVTYGISSDKAITKTVGTVGQDPTYALTAPEVTVDKLKFYVTGTTPASASPGDYNQPKILIVIHGNYTGFAQEFNLQTLVSQRKLDI